MLFCMKHPVFHLLMQQGMFLWRGFFRLHVQHCLSIIASCSKEYCYGWGSLCCTCSTLSVVFCSACNGLMEGGCSYYTCTTLSFIFSCSMKFFMGVYSCCTLTCVRVAAPVCNFFLHQGVFYVTQQYFLALFLIYVFFG